VRLLVFAANHSASRAYAADAEGRVYIERGMYTLRVVAPSVSRFLQGLLT
jgi:hypothetical protein